MTPKTFVPKNPITAGNGWPPPNSVPVHVALWKDATWETVAAHARMPAKKLIEYNFKIAPGEPYYAEKVNHYLKTLVGCTQSTADGYYIFKDANPGLIYFPAALPQAQGTHVIVIGGVSVNEETHDKYPRNFIDPALRRGAAWGQNVHYIFFAPSYEKRVLKQEKEHPLVFIRLRLIQDQCATYDPRHRLTHWEKDPEHFYKVVRNTAASAGYDFTAIKNRNQLTEALQKIPTISTLEYYGHSDHDELYLDFGIDGTRNSYQRWGNGQAESIPASKFPSDAFFASYGCKQGQDGGLADRLRNRWKIKAVGAEGRSNYAVMGDWESLFPDAPGGYYLYPAPTRTKSEPERQRIDKAALLNL
jgi:hypothetical protein